jgi:hypothetical protein
MSTGARPGPGGRLGRRAGTAAIVLGLFLVGVPAAAAPSIPAEHWDTPFQPMDGELIGSYTTVIRQEPDRFVALNNTLDGRLDGGLVLWEGRSPTHFAPVGVVLAHAAISDLLDSTGRPHPERRLTRPYIDWHPRDGYVGIVHVVRGYPPPDGMVYPALVRSRTGAPGSWVYHGRLKGEVGDRLGDSGRAPRWTEGGGFFYQADMPASVNPQAPLRNRYVLFSDGYAGPGSMAILYSADGISWQLYREDGRPDGAIANLTPMLAGKHVLFPHVVRAGRHGWVMFLSEGWPTRAIWRLVSDDGLHWEPFGAQPELRAPPGTTIKNLNGWYDPGTDTLHGYLSVWPSEPTVEAGFRKYHATTRQLLSSGRRDRR